MPNFRTLKNFPESIKCYNTKNKLEIEYLCLRLGFAGTSTSFQIVMNIQKPLLKSSHQKNTCQIFLSQKISESKISNPKKFFDHPYACNPEYPSPTLGAARTGKVRMLVPDDLPRGTVNSLLNFAKF